MILKSLRSLKNYQNIILVSDNFPSKNITIRKNSIFIFFDKNKYLNFKRKYPDQNAAMFTYSNFKNGYNHKNILCNNIYRDSQKIFKDFYSSSIKRSFIFNLYKKIIGSKIIFFGLKKSFLQNAYNIKSIFHLKKILEKKQSMNIQVLLSNNENDFYESLNKKQKGKKSITKVDFEFLKLIIKFIFLPIKYLVNIRSISFKKKSKKLAIKTYVGGLLFNDNEYNIKLFEKSHRQDEIIYLIDTLHHKNFNDKKPGSKCFLYSKYYGSSITSIKSIFIYIIIFFLNLFFFLFFLNKNKFEANEYLKIQSSLLLWYNFINLYNFKHFISYNEYETDIIYRNCFFRKRKIITSKIKQTNSENIFNLTFLKNFIKISDLYNFFDYEFHWTIQSIVMSYKNKSLSDKKFLSGPIWMSKEFVIDKKDNKIKTFAMFNSSFDNINSVNPNLSHLKFLELAQEILNNGKSYQIFFKPKKSYNDYLESDLTSEIAKKLLNNPRFFVENVQTQNHKIYKKTDLSICMPFTSTSIESLYLGNRFVFFDPVAKYTNSIYSKYKNIYFNDLNKILKFIKEFDEQSYVSDLSGVLRMTGISKKDPLSQISKYLN